MHFLTIIYKINYYVMLFSCAVLLCYVLLHIHDCICLLYVYALHVDV